MRSFLFSLLLLLAMAFPALATEYWSGWDSTGMRVEIVVRHEGRLQEGADVFFRDVARSTQAEGTVAAVMYEDASHARAEIRVNGQSRLCELSR